MIWTFVFLAASFVNICQSFSLTKQSRTCGLSLTSTQAKFVKSTYPAAIRSGSHIVLFGTKDQEEEKISPFEAITNAGLAGLHKGVRTVIF